MIVPSMTAIDSRKNIDRAMVTATNTWAFSVADLTYSSLSASGLYGGIGSIS